MVKVLALLDGDEFPASEIRRHITGGTIADGVDELARAIARVRCPTHGEGSATIRIEADGIGTGFIDVRTADECCPAFRTALERQLTGRPKA